MLNEKEIAILMEDRCTRKEAEKHLKNGTTVFEDFSDHIESLRVTGVFYDILDACECKNELEYIDKVRKSDYPDVSIVEYEGQEYLIEYCL